jgi:hypothetical protein
MKRTRTELSIAIENFKISQVEEELELPKVWLKSENQKIILHKTDHNFVKNSLILILFTFLESRYKMLHLLFKVRKASKHQMNTPYFCRQFLFCFAPQQSPPPTPNSVGGRWGYDITCSDIRYFQLRISVNTLPHCSYSRRGIYITNAESITNDHFAVFSPCKKNFFNFFLFSS